MKTESADAALNLYEAGNRKEATAAFQKILRRDADNITAHFYLALIFLAKKQFEKALGHAETVRKLNPKETNIYLNIACIYATQGDIDLAIKFLKKEIAQTPDSPESHYNLGWIYMDRRRWKTAAKYFAKSVEMNNRVEDIVGDLAYCYNKSNQIAQEIDLYKSYLKTRLNDAWATDNLGAALIDIQEYKKSLRYLRKAKKLAPDDPRIDRNIQRSLDGLRQQQEGSR